MSIRKKKTFSQGNFYTLSKSFQSVLVDGRFSLWLGLFFLYANNSLLIVLLSRMCKILTSFKNSVSLSINCFEMNVYSQKKFEYRIFMKKKHNYFFLCYFCAWKFFYNLLKLGKHYIFSIHCCRLSFKFNLTRN